MAATRNTAGVRKKITPQTEAFDEVAIAGKSNAWRTSNIGRLLNEAVHRFEKSVLEKMAAAGHGECTLSHINVTRNLDVEGTRAVELARRASMTKQSLGELVTQLEALGIVTRVPDPTDGRAKVVLFTEKGRDWLENFHAALEQTEKELESELSTTLYKAVKRGLARYAHGAD
ncbi:MarR family transcriptional regulator [Paraburkholderia sprentiae WSM5005]|uniref:MarR family transcriptional regulator n=1 Tax=Paraburkholderia sprentiae WSM5005 TaxID=754502 RepID=A0A1I9YL61_9BURK|nr:MarR family transcriptional regulator [Paraburkholderia sprentiae]APA87044.2 MarR family transcriptional regulator [Paraburkholderia sprentiae WSM5005]